MAWIERASAPCYVALALCLGACGTVQPQQSSAPPETKTAAPAAQRFNLIGYSPAFKQGYADACASPRRQNASRFKSDTDYSMGWQDGQSACRSR